MDVVLCSNNLLAEGIVHTSWLLPPWCLSLRPGSLWSSLRSALCWELAELLLLLRSRLEPLWLRCWPLPLRLRSRLEALGLRCSRLGCTRRRRVGLELTEGLPLLRGELLLLNGKVLLVNLEMTAVCVLLVSSRPECSCSRLLLLLRCWTELLLLRLDRGWPELLLRSRPKLLLLRSRLEPLLLRLELLLLWLELLLRLELLLLGLELLLLWLTQLLNGDGLACLVNELGNHLALGAGNVDRLLTRLPKDGELSRLQLYGGCRTHTLLLGDGQGGEGGDEDEGVPHAGADLTGTTRPAVALYAPTPVIVHVGKQCCLGNTAKWQIPTKAGILVKSFRIALPKNATFPKLWNILCSNRFH